MAEKGYYPFVVIRPENEASQSLYKKLGFRRLYQIVRMIFTPSTWQDSENDANILRDNLENAVRQLTIEQRVITALRDREEESGETIRDPTGAAGDQSIVGRPDGTAEDEELLETVEEQHPEERIDADDATDDNTAGGDDAPPGVADCCDCGTDAAAGDE